MGALGCDRCGADNDPGRRLCRRCGNWLVVPPAQPAGPRGQVRRGRPWWLGGERTEYSANLSRSTVLYRIAAGLVAVVLVVGLLTVVGLHPVRRVTDQLGHVRGTGKVTGVTASSGEPQGDPAAAVDDVRAQVWSPLWSGGPAEVDPEDVCASAATPGPAITLTLPGATDLREIGFEAGLPDGDPRRAERWRPRVVRLDWAGGGCRAVELDDVPALQRFFAGQDDEVTGVTVTVVSAYPPKEAAAGPVDVGEITFWQR